MEHGSLAYDVMIGCAVLVLLSVVCSGLTVMLWICDTIALAGNYHKKAPNSARTSYLEAVVNQTYTFTPLFPDQ